MAIDVPIRLQDEFSRQYNSLMGNINKQAASAESLMKGVGLAIGAAFSFAAIKSFVKEANDAEVQTTKLAQALKNTGNDTEENRKAMQEFSSALMEKVAVDDDVITGLQSTALAMTGNITAAQELTKASLDLAAGLGISADQAIRMFSKTQEGSEGLKKIGITIGKTGDEHERLATIMEEVGKRYGGMAEAFAGTNAGKIQAAEVAVGNLKEEFGRLLNIGIAPQLPAFTNLVRSITDSVTPAYLHLAIGVGSLLQIILSVPAVVEQTLNVMNQMAGGTGIISNAVVRAGGELSLTVEQMKRQLDGLKNQATTSISGIGKVSGDTKAETILLKDSITDLKKELDALNPGTTTYTQKLRELNIVQAEYNRLVATSQSDARNQNITWAAFATTLNTKVIPAMTGVEKKYKDIKAQPVKLAEENSAAFDQIMEDFYDSQDRIQTISMATYQAIGSGMQQIFAGAAGGAGGMINQVGNMIISTVEGLMVAAAAAGKAWGVITFGVSLVKDIALLASGFALLEQARAILNRSTPSFHTGGSGFFDAPPSEEAFVKIRGQEKIRVTTPEQERAGGFGGGNTTVIQLNFNHPVSGEEFIKNGAEMLMRKMGVTDIRKVFVNQNANIALGT